MTQNLGTKIMMKLYTFQENKNISPFHMENNCGYFKDSFCI